MSFTFKQDPVRPRRLETDNREPHTRILHNDRECGIIVHDERDDVYDIWIAVQKNGEVPDGHIKWKWIEFTTRPALLAQAQRVADNNYDSITAKYQLHYFPAL